MTLVQRFLTGTYEVTRTTAGQNIKGRYVPGPKETLQVEGSMQPTTGRELKLPPEGARLRQYFIFYTDQKILNINTKSLGDSDVITIDGDTYRAMEITPWRGTDLDHYKTLVWREPEQ